MGHEFRQQIDRQTPKLTSTERGDHMHLTESSRTVMLGLRRLQIFQFP